MGEVIQALADPGLSDVPEVTPKDDGRGEGPWVPSVLGASRFFVPGGTGHSGTNDGERTAVVAAKSNSSGSTSCAS